MNILSSGRSSSRWFRRTLNLLRHSRQSPATFLARRQALTIQALCLDLAQV